MNIISIGTDRNVFVEGSAVRARVIEYGSLFDELHIVVFARRSHNVSKVQIASNVWAYPTRSLSRLLYVRDALKIVLTIIRERKFVSTNTVVTCQDPFETGLVGMRIKKKTRIPLHIQIHTDFLSPFFKKESILNRFRVHLSKKILKCADALRVVSLRIKKSIIDAGISAPEIAVLPIFIDQQVIRDTPVDIDLKKKYSQFNFIILMASRLTKEKNIQLGLDAFAEVVKKYPRAGMVIVGSGPEEVRLKRYVKEKHLVHNVVFESWKHNLVSYYKTAHMFLLTSNYEGYGLTIVEALVAGCPTLSTDVGIAPDVLVDGDVFVCPVGDKTCLVNNLFRYIENNYLRETFTQEATRRLNKVTYPSKDTYLAAYKASIESALTALKK